MWTIVASKSIRDPENPPSMWTGEGYGEMQKALNNLHDAGYRKFNVEENVS